MQINYIDLKKTGYHFHISSFTNQLFLNTQTILLYSQPKLRPKYKIISSTMILITLTVQTLLQNALELNNKGYSNNIKRFISN